MKFTVKKACGTSLSALLGCCALLGAAEAEKCPFLRQQQQLEIGADMIPKRSRRLEGEIGDHGVPKEGFAAVEEDLMAIMTDSQDFWPGDFAGTPHGPHYGGLFIRLAWHCSGSYRESDGRGGCDGGRIRFDPELNWMDNGNLDKALRLLEPIKEKYGESLSWGDLIVLSGNAAIKSMGGSTIGFCGGRIDDLDASDSLKLGPSAEQEEIGPCQSLEPSMQGQCLAVEGTALGPTTVGLIYVNPEGAYGKEGDPVASGEDVRTAFSRMGFGDQESVALIGGGHAFGKAHGACEEPPCGDGLGPNAYTSGFEGAWTTIPTTWSNQYFNNLFDYNWTVAKGPGGFLQAFPTTFDGSAAPDIFMLVTDLAMAADEKYLPISQKYAADLDALTEDFATAWYRLTSADMGPHTRCVGDMVPDPQPFQGTLMEAETKPDYIPIRTKIQGLIDSDPANRNAFINLAYNCAATFRSTDYRGGCNGARIRLEPESSWSTNEGTADALATLESILSQEEDNSISMADLIVLAGQTAAESSNPDLRMDFCGGRVDADDATFSESLAPRFYPDPVVSIRDDMQVKGLTTEQGVALAARNNLSTQYFQELLDSPESVASMVGRQGSDSEGTFTEHELAMKEAEFLPVVEKFAQDEEALLAAFSSGWTYMMTADRYKNYMVNACDGVSDATLPVSGGEDSESEDTGDAEGSAAPSTFAVASALVLVAFGQMWHAFSS